ncbi:MAG TPA: alpha/beta hydrolase [Planosporangium sp.]|jgi:pimeloyl-ACP methyl ester carboxylesterase|nr:alpha/beta hydrolase [Planosporangium sp.]
MRLPGNPRRLMLRLTREAATTALAVVVGFSGWLFGPADAAAAASASAAPPGVATWRADRIAGQRLPDPSRAAPAQVARFFAHLDPGQRAALADRYPDIVGNLDGAPLDLRFEVNARLSSWSPERHVISYDRRGNGHVAEVMGDLATADRIAVIVPGLSNRLDNFDRGCAGRERRAPAWQARQLYQQVRALDGTARVAVIAWLGYDPPEGIGREAVREERARAGAAALSRFVGGLGLYRPAATVTLVGHSYGSVVAGLAAPSLGRRVRDIVALGSPGMGVERAAELRTTARVWAGSTLSDWTRDVPGIRLFGAGHGTLPFDAAFGARPLPVDNVVEHDGYFVPGSDSLRAVAQIALGRSTNDRG